MGRPLLNRLQSPTLPPVCRPIPARFSWPRCHLLTDPNTESSRTIQRTKTGLGTQIHWPTRWKRQTGTCGTSENAFPLNSPNLEPRRSFSRAFIQEQSHHDDEKHNPSLFRNNLCWRMADGIFVGGCTKAGMAMSSVQLRVVHRLVSLLFTTNVVLLRTYSG